MKGDGIGWDMWHAWGRKVMCRDSCSEDMKGRRHLEIPAVDGSIILK